MTELTYITPLPAGPDYPSGYTPTYRLPLTGDGTEGPEAPVTPVPEPPGFPRVPELPEDDDEAAPATEDADARQTGT